MGDKLEYDKVKDFVFNLAQHRVEVQGSRAAVSPVEQWGQAEGYQDDPGYGDQGASGVNALGKGSKGGGKGKGGPVCWNCGEAGTHSVAVS